MKGFKKNPSQKKVSNSNSSKEAIRLERIGDEQLAIGELTTANNYFKKAIESNPKKPDLFFKLGLIRQLKKAPEEAIEFYNKAIEKDPNFSDAYANLGGALLDLGLTEEALKVLITAIEINPNSACAIENLKSCASRLPDIKDEEATEKVYEILIKRTDFRHQYLSKIFTRVHKDQLKLALKNWDSEEPSKNKYLRKISSDWRLKKSLTLLIPADREIEILLTELRHKLLLLSISTRGTPETVRQLTESLASQCHLNEYAYYESPEESALVESITKQLCNKSKLIHKYLAAVGCYRSIESLNIDQNQLELYPIVSEESNAMMHLHIKEERQLAAIKSSLIQETNLNNTTSINVKKMYEDNPYPRYRYTQFTPSLAAKDIRSIINNETTSRNIKFDMSWSTNNFTPKVLIAGCGTGAHLLSSSRYKNARITAIDISSTSLAYAILKAKEYSFCSVQYHLLDILEVNRLNTQFDVIECSGVLHHMQSPEAGLKALINNLKPGGFIKIALYSELGRAEVIKARDFIAKESIESNSAGIRSFRKQVLEGEVEELNSLPELSHDFYTISACRDLCFHVSEHRFSINSLKKLLANSKLLFKGFILPSGIGSYYKSSFPEDSDMTSLDNWSKFEESNPNTFRGMYQFWAQSPFKTF